jgi:outer membrane protein, heavy metal efflux system
MSKCWLAMVCVLILVSGCRTPPLESVDQTVADLANHPFDVAPVPASKPVDAKPPTDGTPADGKAADAAPSAALPDSRPPSDNVIPASYSQVQEPAPGQVKPPLLRLDIKIPAAVPGSEAPLVTLPPTTDPARPEAVNRLFPKLPPLPEEPISLPGPNGRPYTLADLHRIAAENNPTIRQAASDIEAARGVLKQSVTYPNPTIGFESGPNNNNTATGTQGYFIDQVIKTGGKLTLAGAQAQMNVYNAELALKRARSNLVTTIRGDYYSLLVARETVRVNKALAHFTDEIFRLQADLMAGGFVGSYEPAALRSQSFVIRLAYKQAIANYIYAWKQLVADMGLRQMPLSAVEGEVDRLIPNYDYDAVLAHVLRNHTDVRTAKNNLEAARYGLKLAQVTPVPDVEVRGDLWREQTIQPFQNFTAVTVSIPFPVWDQNKGNIRAAAAGLVRAGEGPHQIEVAITTGLAAAYGTYQANLAAMEYYRRNILPDMVRYYRGVFERRRVDPGVAFGDLVAAQQILTTDVTAYLGVLGSLWTSVVSVADYIQTDDLFQLGKPLELPKLPDLDLHSWPCPHPPITGEPAKDGPTATAVPGTGATSVPAPTTPPAPAQPLHPPIGGEPAKVDPATTPVPFSGLTAAPTRNALPATPGRRIDTAATLSSVTITRSPNPRQPGRDPDKNLPPPKPGTSASTTVKAPQEQFAKLLGVVEPSFGDPTSTAAPSVAQPSGPITPDPLRLSGAASSEGGSK